MVIEQKKQTNKEIEAFFIKLVKACREKETYSIIEVTRKMDFNYKQIEEWAKSDERWYNALDFCRMCCTDNAEIAGLYARIPPKEAFKYMCENDDEFKVYYEKQEKHLMHTKKEVVRQQD